MQRVSLQGLSTILCIGAHSDDIEIGAGATVLKLIRDNPSARIVWVVLAASGLRGDEARAAAAGFLEHAGSSSLHLKQFRDGHFPDQWAELKAFVESLKSHAPDLVLCHYGKDLHQDHRLVSELVWNTFRDHFILEYEIPKYDGGLGSPNFFGARLGVGHRSKDRPADVEFREPDVEALVRGSDVSRPDASARAGILRAGPSRRGVLRSKGVP